MTETGNGTDRGHMINDFAAPNDNLEEGYRGTAVAGNAPSYGHVVPYGQTNSMTTNTTLTSGVVHDQATVEQQAVQKEVEVVPSGKKKSRLSGRIHF
jgi:hypothetical protein